MLKYSKKIIINFAPICELVIVVSINIVSNDWPVNWISGSGSEWLLPSLTGQLLLHRNDQQDFIVCVGSLGSIHSIIHSKTVLRIVAIVVAATVEQFLSRKV